MAKLAHRGCVVGTDISEQMIDFVIISLVSNLMLLLSFIPVCQALKSSLRPRLE
ncbi:hypothetical protein [Legionella micdadei]|uniref:hypothetical protein n=1 Tax=Legionella micdadei TaxID=451 RepID=UPI0009E983CD|nr:hypothetical protein B6V88_11835 [Legionella micdadei]